MRFIYPLICLFVLFLLAGSVIRGIVDTTATAREIRRVISLPAMTAFVGISAVYALVRGKKQGEDAADSVGRFVLVSWVVFAFVFFASVFLYLVSDDGALSGNLVVVSRSMLEVAFWMLLCDLASRGNVAPVPLFICCGALVETASWALSYVMVPSVLAISADSSTTLVLVSIFGAVSAVTVVCGVLVIGFGRSRSVIPSYDWVPGTAVKGASANEVVPVPVEQEWEVLTGELVDGRGLTFREAAVAVRYAHGYSIAKVSEELGVTVGAAQSSIRSVYRKLDVHTKDDLIEVVDGLSR